MNASTSRFALSTDRSSASSDGRLRRVGLLAFAAVACLSLTSCMDEAGKMSAVTDPLHEQIEKREQELEALRNSETQLKTEIAALESRLSSLEDELARKGADGAKLQELADAIAKLPGEIEPMVAASVSEAVKDIQIAAAPAPAPAPAPAATADSGTAANPGATGAPIATPAPGGTGVEVRPADPGRERRVINFGD